jgi:hypothetical protein
MLREVFPYERQAQEDAQRRLQAACELLRWIDPELAEWTVLPPAPEGQGISARMLLTDARRPLEQLARLLRRTADQVERLARHQRLTGSCE